MAYLKSSKNPFTVGKKKPDPRLQSKRWKEQSKAFIREHPWCAYCHSPKNLTVDHILPKSKHPELFWHISNWQVLCNKCNASKKDK